MKNTNTVKKTDLSSMQHTNLRKEMPWHYPACIKQDCPLAQKCLHAIAYTLVEATDRDVLIVNPLQATATTACKLFSDSTPIRYAVGFRNFKEHMYPGQYSNFSSICRSRFSRNEYYKRRRGATPMSPEEQKYVKNALKQTGVKEELDFDDYIYKVSWD